MTPRLHLLATSVLAVAALPAAAQAASYTSYSLSSAKAPVEGLAGARADQRARVVLPSTWRRLAAPAGTLRFREGHGTCVFTVSFRLRARVAPAQSPADHVLADLPVPAPAYALDAGVRAPGAWRVTRRPFAAGVNRLDGEYARVPYTQPGLVPAGQSAFSEIVATAASRRGDICHSGTYRATLGPALGDAFATTRFTAYVRRG